MLLESTYPAASRLRTIVDNDDAPFNAQISASNSILDRADLAAKQRLEIEAPRFIDTLAIATGSRVVRMTDDDGEPDMTSSVEAGFGGDVIDAELVEASAAEPAPTQRPVRIERAEPVVPAMLSQTDLQEGRGRSRSVQPRRSRTTQSEFG